MVRCIVRWFGVSIWIVEAIAELDIRPLPLPVPISLYFSRGLGDIAYILDHRRLVYDQHIALLYFPFGVYYYRARVGYIRRCVRMERNWPAGFHSPRPMTSRNKRADQGRSPIGMGEQARGACRNPRTFGPIPEDDRRI